MALGLVFPYSQIFLETKIYPSLLVRFSSTHVAERSRSNFERWFCRLTRCCSICAWELRLVNDSGRLDHACEKSR
jgi:hypothetical protein